jgi:hypothetical protein
MVDLSTHNADIECASQHALIYTVPPSFTHREMMALDKAVFRKQSNFIRTIQGRPHWGKYIRTLHWTVLDASDQYWGSRENILDDHGAIVNNDDEDNSDEEERPIYAPEDGKKLGI